MRTATKKLLRMSVLAAMSATMIGGLATPSQATVKSTVRMEGSTIVFTGTAADNDVKITKGWGTRVRVQDKNGDIAPSGGCYLVPGGPGYHDFADCTVNSGAITGIVASLGDGDDRFTTEVGLGGQVLGEGGSDHFAAGAAKTAASGITYSGGADSEGHDVVSYSRAGLGVAVTLDGIGNDGRAGLDGDNVSDDVEGVEGSAHDDALTGNDQSNVLVGGLGRDTIDSRGGADRILANDGIVDGTLDCGAGDDLVRFDSAKEDPATTCEIRLPQ
ncbi:hypothetical protein [Streptosporangium sp. OZ121]|uniref:hypothetical protein n=1 Tax=Streptosporangium sp. OZ121 TaxID=3444183 RepID=UPI003F79040C